MTDEIPRILIVDDAPTNIRVLNEALESEYRISFAANGGDALSVASSIIPDLILLDIMMPDMDGYEVCRRLKADPALRDIPVIFITALNQQENEEVGLKLGGVDYITKPCNPALVRLRVRNQLELKRQRDMLADLNRALEEKVRQRTSSLEAAVRELESMCYAISHDLRPPLRHINAFSAILAEEQGDNLDSESRQALSRIGAATVRMGALVDALLNLPRLCRRELHCEAVDLSAIARETLAELRGSDQERQAETGIQDGLVVEGDPVLLKVAMEQLLDNAWKFSGGKSPARIAFGIEEREGKKVYYVRDNGAGFDMAYVGKLFGIFQRLHTEGEFEGLGIGLATVQRIIAAHGGEIWAEGVVGEGATFRFTLPQPFSGQSVK